jgi:hypothetical protein
VRVHDPRIPLQKPQVKKAFVGILSNKRRHQALLLELTQTSISRLSVKNQDTLTAPNIIQAIL